MTIEGQQQHETVTAITMTQSNVHKLLTVQEVIFPTAKYYLPLQQLNIK